MPCRDTLSLRPLEREDLKFVHQLNNNASIMRYWFEEPYEAYMELAQLTPEQVTHLKARYLPFQDQGCVAEILRWLDGEYVFDPDCLTD